MGGWMDGWMGRWMNGFLGGVGKSFAAFCDDLEGQTMIRATKGKSIDR